MGRAYLIYGSAHAGHRDPADDRPGRPGAGGLADLEHPDVRQRTCTQLAAGPGRRWRAIGDVITDGFADIAIGAPAASFNGLAGNGAVYVVSGDGAPAGPDRDDPAGPVGQTGALGRPACCSPGSGRRAGRRRPAPAGNFDGDISGAGSRSRTSSSAPRPRDRRRHRLPDLRGAGQPGTRPPGPGVPDPATPARARPEHLADPDPGRRHRPRPASRPCRRPRCAAIAGIAFIGEPPMIGDRTRNGLRGLLGRRLQRRRLRRHPDRLPRLQPQPHRLRLRPGELDLWPAFDGPAAGASPTARSCVCSPRRRIANVYPLGRIPGARRATWRGTRSRSTGRSTTRSGSMSS